MVYNTELAELQHHITRERREVIETELESVVVILGEESKCLIPLVSNFDPLLRDFDKVLTELAQAEVSCREYQEQWQQEEVYVKTLKQQKKSLELRIVEIETLHQAELRRWTEEKKGMERRVEDFEWKLEQRDTDMQRLTKVNTDLQRQLSTSSEQLQNIKKARNATRKFSTAVRMIRQQKDTEVTQKIIKKLEEDSEQYCDRFNLLDNENSALARQLEEAHDLLDEMRKRDDMMSGERREWKVQKEDLLEESAHLTGQIKDLETELRKHRTASKNLQSLIKKAETDAKTAEKEVKKIADENQLLESKMVRMRNILVSEGVNLERYPELDIALPYNQPSNLNIQKGGSVGDSAFEGQVLTSSTPVKPELHRQEVSLQDELDFVGSVDTNGRFRSTSSENDQLELKYAQLEQELIRSDTEKSALLVDVRRAEKSGAAKDKEIAILKDEVKALNHKIAQLQAELEAYEEQRGVMESEQIRLASQMVRDGRTRRSLRRNNSTVSTDSDTEQNSENLFEENMQLMREKQALFEKYTKLEASALQVERTLKQDKLEAERKLNRLEEDYSNLMRSEEMLSTELREVRGRLEKLKVLYSLLQSEDNEGEDPEELVARLKYKRGEVEALLRDRTEMRTQIVSLQRMLHLRSSEEEEPRDVNSGGIVQRVLSALRKRRRSSGNKTIGAIGNIAHTSSGSLGQELGYSLVERQGSKRPPIPGHLDPVPPAEPNIRKIEDLKELSSVPRRVANGWTYSPAGLFSMGLPPCVPTYSKLLVMDGRPQKVICACFVPCWPFPRLSGVKIQLNRKSSGSPDSVRSQKGTLTRDSSGKSKDSSTRGSIRSLESKDSIRSTRSLEGTTNFPLLEEAVSSTEHVAMGMLCLSSFKPLTALAVGPQIASEISTQVEDRFSAALFSQEIVRDAVRRVPSAPAPTPAQTKGESSSDTEYLGEVEEEREEAEEDDGRNEAPAPPGDEDEDDPAELRRELFKQTKEAFLQRPVSSFRHKVAHSSRSQYPYLWVVAHTREEDLSFLHLVNLNFPARVERTQFLCEGKVLAMRVVKNIATDDTEQVTAKKVLFGGQRPDQTSSCWMGTTDGRIFVIELREPFSQVFSKQFTDSVLQIEYTEPRVLVSLRNGALVVFNRDREGRWDVENYQIIVIDTTGRKVRRIAEVGGRAWCGSGPTVSVCDVNSYRVLEKIDVVINNSEQIREICPVGDTVWVSLTKSTKVVIFAAQTKQLLRVISLKGYLLRTGLRHGLDLQRTDLYITSLFYDGSLLWIGTNIGVVLAVVFPTPGVPSLVGEGDGGRTSNLSSLDDELCWDPCEKLALAQPAHKSSWKSRGSSLTDCSPPSSDAASHDADPVGQVIPEGANHVTEGDNYVTDPANHVIDPANHVIDPANVPEIAPDHVVSAEVDNAVEEVAAPAVNGLAEPAAAVLSKEPTFEYSDPEETATSPEPPKSSDEISEMLASFDLDSAAQERVLAITEEHILFSIYGTQGPVSCFSGVSGDEDLPSLLCTAGIGFDDYEVKGLKNLRRKDCIQADSPTDPKLLAQLLIWSYSRKN